MLLDEIRIDRTSDVSLRRQLVNQFVVQIASGKLQPGDRLPSVRQLERVKKIHRHTISRAYRELVAEGWLSRVRGSSLKVNAFERPTGSTHDLNSLVETAVQAAQEHGYTPEQFLRCVQAQLVVRRAEQILVVSTDAGLAAILKTELQESTRCRVHTCLLRDLAKESRRLRRVLVVWAAGAAKVFSPELPKGIPTYSIRICDPAEQLERIRQLRKPSVVAIASVSQLFIERAVGTMSPLMGESHSLCQYFLQLDERKRIDADLVFCDSVAARRIQSREVHCYHIVSPESLDYIKRVVK